MKKKMTKSEISKIKKEAKARKNRRLNEGEFRRVMAKYSPKEDNENDLPIIDINDLNREIKELSESKLSKESDRSLISEHKPIASIHVAGLPKNNPHINDLVKKFDKELKSLNPPQEYRSKKSNRRLSNKQFKSLMKKAAIELGINDNKGTPIIDLNETTSAKDFNNQLWWQQHQDKVIDMVFYGNSSFVSLADEYKKIIRGRKLSFADKLNIIYYLIMKKTTPKPMCLLSKKEKTNEIRKVVKPRGDIKERPFRLIPDEEYFKEITKSKRTKRDYFDKLDIDDKIDWARYANLILDISTEHFGSLRIHNETDVEIVTFAMKYACKMSKIPEFKGDFANPYWTLYRVYRYCNHMTNSEYKVYYKMALEHLNINKRTIPIINASDCVEKLIPTLKSCGVYKKYVGQKKDNSLINLGAAKELIFRKFIKESDFIKR